MNIPAWVVAVGLVVIIILGVAWVYSRGTDQGDHQDADNDKSER